MNNGKLGEMIAITHFTEKGYEIYIPMGGCGHCDFIAVSDEEILKVEVKSTMSKNGEIDLRRAKANVSKDKKLFDSSKSNIVFLVNLNTRAYKILVSSDLEGRRSIRIK